MRDLLHFPLLYELPAFCLFCYSVKKIIYSIWDRNVTRMACGKWNPPDNLEAELGRMFKFLSHMKLTYSTIVGQPVTSAKQETLCTRRGLGDNAVIFANLSTKGYHSMSKKLNRRKDSKRHLGISLTFKRRSWRPWIGYGEADATCQVAQRWSLQTRKNCIKFQCLVYIL